MLNKKTLKAKFDNATIQTKIKEAILTIVALVCLSGTASAQTKKEKSDQKDTKTEVKIGFNNLSVLELQKDKTTFYNDFMPTFKAGIKKNNFYGNFTASELIMMNNGDFSVLNNTCLVEIGKYFGPNTKLFLKAGRETTELGTAYLNGVKNMEYDTEKNVAIFGNLNERMVLGIQKNGTLIELGLVGTFGQGIFIIPNPQQADFWLKLKHSFEKNGWKISLSTATEIGNISKIFGNITVTNDHIGVTGGGNYNFNTDTFNAYIRGAYTSVTTGITYITQGLKKGETYSFQIGISKNGIQGFLGIDNITPTQNNTPEFTSTPTVNAGISYSFGKNKTL